MPLPDLTASVIVRAHEPMTIKPAKQINAIAISLILASSVWLGNRIGIVRVFDALNRPLRLK
jgi:hypothetical protein